MDSFNRRTVVGAVCYDWIIFRGGHCLAHRHSTPQDQVTSILRCQAIKLLGCL